MEKPRLTQITTSEAPAAIGSYSQAIRCGQFVYTCGQIPLENLSATMYKPKRIVSYKICKQYSTVQVLHSKA